MKFLKEEFNLIQVIKIIVMLMVAVAIFRIVMQLESIISLMG